MADYIGATPQVNPMMGLLSERLKQAQQFAAKPFGYQNPPAEMLMNLLGIPAVQQTAERIAYGEPLTTGRGMTTQVRPEVIEAAMTVAPAAGLLGRGVERGAMAAGRAGERYAEKVVPQIMERGGMPAQLLGDLAQGSTRKMYVPATQQEAFEASKLLRNNTPQEVWAKTGVAKYGDDFVKEISDKDAVVGFTNLIDVNNGDRLRELAFDNPELYALMPELKKFGQLGLREERMRGSFQGVGDAGSLIGYAPNEKDLKTVLAHEMQHGVQSLQGWERGGSPKDIALDLAENKLKAEEVMTKLERLQNVASDEARRANPELIAQAKKWADETGGPWYEGADEKMITKDYLLSQDPVYKSLYQTHADLAYNKPALLGADETYNRLAAEVQARSTQNRIDLTDAERRQYFPFELKSEANPYGLDVAPEDLLYRSQMGENTLRTNPKAAMEGLLGQSNATSASSLSDIENKFKDIALDVYEKNGTINLSRIVVPKEMRSSGIGSSAMNDLTSYADQTGQKMALTPSDDFGGNVKRLKDFYKQFGFVENKGKNKDFSTMETMIRLPDIRKEPKEITNLLD